MIKKKARKYSTLIVTLVVVTAILYIFSSRNGVTKVNVTKPEVRSISKTISASGSTDVPENSTVRALIGGSIKKINFQGGDEVKKGDVILEMDQASLKASLDAAYAAYLASKSDVDTYSQRLKAAQATESVRKQERDKVWRAYMEDNGETNKNAYKNAEALYQTALSALTTLKDSKNAEGSSVSSAYSAYISALNNYRHSTIVAPADGHVALSSIYPGSYVVAGQELFSVTSDKDLLFKSEVDEADVENVKPGMKVKLSLDSYPGQVFDGKVGRVDAKVVVLPNGSTAVMSDVLFDNPEILPIKGLNGTADIEIAKSDSVLSITPDCIVEETDKKYVYILKDNKVYKTEVVTGFEGDEYTAIVSGLTGGETVVSDPGSYKLKDGQQVKI